MNVETVLLKAFVEADTAVQRAADEVARREIEYEDRCRRVDRMHAALRCLDPDAEEAG